MMLSRKWKSAPIFWWWVMQSWFTHLLPPSYQKIIITSYICHFRNQILCMTRLESVDETVLCAGRLSLVTNKLIPCLALKDICHTDKYGCYMDNPHSSLFLISLTFPVVGASFRNTTAMSTTKKFYATAVKLEAGESRMKCFSLL